MAEVTRRRRHSGGPPPTATLSPHKDALRVLVCRAGRRSLVLFFCTGRSVIQYSLCVAGVCGPVDRGSGGLESLSFAALLTPAVHGSGKGGNRAVASAPFAAGHASAGRVRGRDVYAASDGCWSVRSLAFCTTCSTLSTDLRHSPRRWPNCCHSAVPKLRWLERLDDPRASRAGARTPDACRHVSRTSRRAEPGRHARGAHVRHECRLLELVHPHVHEPITDSCVARERKMGACFRGHGR